MANLREISIWEEGIYQLETSDPVMGGADGIDNRQPRQLANRTLWLKTELTKAVTSIGQNKTAAEQALAAKADKTTTVTAGNGLTGGGDLAANRAIALGTPGTITASSGNTVTDTSHTHAIASASLTAAGVVQLSNAINSNATNMAATPKAVMDALAAANGGNLTLHGALGGKNLDGLKGEAHYGVHHQTVNAEATAQRNYPIQLAGTLLVLPAAYQGRQLYLPFTRAVIYVRTTDNGGNWSAWAALGEVANSLDSNSTTAALSAAQGKVLNDTKLGNRGDQTISNGTLTVANAVTINGGGSSNLVLGSRENDVYIRNTHTNKYLQLKDDGTLAYSNDKVMLYTDRSDAVNLDTTAKLATSRAVKTAYDKAVSAETPSGTVAYFAGSAAPPGWLKANGAALSRTSYAGLFAAIGTTYGAGDGRTTFNLPDLRGEFIRGWDDGRGIDASRGFASLQSDELKKHTHTMTYIAGAESSGGSSNPDGLLSINHDVVLGTHTNTGIINQAGGAETRPRNVALLACIKI